MGMSGMKGKVYCIDASCPTVNCDEQFAAPPGDGECWGDEVTRFTIVDSVQKREYGHDKSGGWQDVCAGIRKAAITVDAVIRDPASATRADLVRAGKVLYLQLYPFGNGATCSTPCAGYAMIDQISYTYDQETGLPAGYSATLSSKGPWTGMGTGAHGGFECNCSGA